MRMLKNDVDKVCTSGPVKRNNPQNIPEKRLEADKNLVHAMIKHIDGFNGWIHPKMSQDTNREALIVNFNLHFK